ncbi:hypothetical protein JCGZ_01147 [Jatropha curcas]|uniref:Aminotransferase-like plant mobile domain-containing protein n=1 Tax=Jatropha curcas TaxID=180498 RepID=A0A067JSZ1_JATCU|nr:hypothetical protein JCGZ_01147 [Jatropha curcas]
MTSLGHSSDEDFLESLGISLETDLTADVETHTSVTGIYAWTWAFEYFPYTRPELIHAVYYSQSGKTGFLSLKI